MDISKKKLNIKEYILFIYLIVFPFGQLFSFRIKYFNLTLPVHLTDIVILIYILMYIFNPKKIPKIFEYIKFFLFFLFLSYIFSFTIFPPREVIVGGLYLARVVIYSLFFLSIFNYVKEQEKRRILLLNSLILICFYIAIFGILQYIFVPDIRPFTIYGWDDHLYRLVSTFIDPGFTAIFLVFGFLASLSKYLDTKENKLLFIITIFIISLALTYSRAGYLALFAGTIVILSLKKKLGKILFLLVTFSLLIYFIPNYGSEGVRLFRTRSVYARFQSYSEGIEILKKSPLLGIGFDNLCYAKAKFLRQDANFESHSCSGLESGLLVILTTSGLIGFLIFLYSSYKILLSVKGNLYGLLFISSFSALSIHNLFINSFFYPWVMGYMGILLAISIKE